VQQDEQDSTPSENCLDSEGDENSGRIADAPIRFMMSILAGSLKAPISMSYWPVNC
jgi:hypothetical protein